MAETSGAHDLPGASAPVLDAPVPGVPTPVLPGVVRLTAPNPSLMTGPGTNTYLVGTKRLVAVDPGPADGEHIEAVAATAAGRLEAIVVTHTHPDHAPGSAWLASLTGARMLGYGPRDGFEPDAQLEDGDHVQAGDLVLQAVHTPGHASNHLCYLLNLPSGDGGSHQVLFSGDHVMGGSTVVIAPPDGDMDAYLASLRRMLELDPPLTVIAPGHGPLLPDPRAVLEGYLAHRLAREESIADALAGGESTVEGIVSAVYTDVPEALHPVARYSVWAHLRRLAGEQRAISDDPDEITATWRPVEQGTGSTSRDR